MLWFFPSVLLILVYGLALGLLLSALNVYLRDIQYLTDVVMMLAMWGSPIVYSWTMVSTRSTTSACPPGRSRSTRTTRSPSVSWGSTRRSGVRGHAADYPDNLALRMLIAGVIGLVLLFLSHRVFTRLQGNFAQEL